MSSYNKNFLKLIQFLSIIQRLSHQLDFKWQNFKENLDLYEADVSKLSCNYHLSFILWKNM